MNDELLERFVCGVERLAAALEGIASAKAPESPDHRFPLSAYAGFDWSVISAEPVARDQSGPMVVRWNGFTFVRRFAESAKYGKAIMFSRNAGRSEDGNEYFTLVKFSDNMNLEALPSSFPQERPRIQRPNSVPPPVPPTEEAQDEPEGSPAPEPTANPSTMTRPLTLPQIKHFQHEARTAKDEFLFVTAVNRLHPDYTVDRLSSLRAGVCVDAITELNAPAQLEAVEKYIARRKELEKSGVPIASAYATAKTDAAAAYARLRGETQS